MSDSDNDTSGLERDPSGRFVKRPVQDETANNVPPDGPTHPMAQTLFGWVAFQGSERFFFFGLGALSLFLIVIDLAFDRHEKVETANITGFYGFYGFLAFALVVLAGWPLGRLLRRDENYYGDQDDGEGGA